MDVSRRSLGAAVALVGVLLWIVAVAVDASMVAVVIPILMVMGGGALLAVDGGRAEDGEGPDAS